MSQSRSILAIVAVLFFVLLVGVAGILGCILYFRAGSPPVAAIVESDADVEQDKSLSSVKDSQAPAQATKSADPVKPPDPRQPEELEPPIEPNIERRTGSFFGPAPVDPYRAPQVIELWTPPQSGDAAVWGATGRDDRGHIWYGVSVTGQIKSAHLYELDPKTNESHPRGDVISEMRRAGIYEDGIAQAKIHTRIVQADDGYLYFASMDEDGEEEDGSRLPDHGSHIWRLHPAAGDWELLHSVPEALIAMATAGRWIYALGYFGHILYQLDTKTGEARSVRVGSVAGHVSRNFLADLRGHAYVPRLVRADDENRIDVTLVEFDATLREVGETPIEHYFGESVQKSHGITAVLTLPDRSLVFATDQGYLYRIVPSPNTVADLIPLGWFHPEGVAYTSSLFTYNGNRFLMGVANKHGTKDYRWLVYDMLAGQTRAFNFTLIDLITPARSGLLLYGSITRDDAGQFYVVGRYRRDGVRPIVLQVLAE